MDISVIIVSYNTADLTLACINSILLSQGVNYEIFVVDNNSSDGSVDAVRDRFPNVRVISNTTNRGFGTANNQALKECSGDYVVFLNPDTTVEPDSLFNMLQFMGSHPEVGLAGPKVFNPDGSRQDSVSYRYPGHRYGAADIGVLPGTIACVLGACQIVSRKLLQEINGFDEDFFLYGEDQDICLRIRKRGFEIALINEASIMHLGGQSERRTLPEDVVRKKFRGELIFYRKHYCPDTIHRLCKRQLRRAAWRMFSSRVLMIVFPNASKVVEKFARYRALREEIRVFVLDHHGPERDVK